LSAVPAAGEGHGVTHRQVDARSLGWQVTLLTVARSQATFRLLR